jgi:uncharacterized protein YbjQ (UPF0145 family)
MLVVTTEHIPGFEVSAAIGEVCGVAVIQKNMYTGGIKNLAGEMNPTMRKDLADAREHAVAEMVRAARRKGANAVVGMRYSARDIHQFWSEICAYGTAVRVGPAVIRNLPPAPPPPPPPGQPPAIGSARPT